jgi:hypothetical protein
MPSGRVKFFNTDRGYGFIAPDGGGSDVFVHVHDVEAAGMKILVPYWCQANCSHMTSALRATAAQRPLTFACLIPSVKKFTARGSKTGAGTPMCSSASMCLQRLLARADEVID